MTARPPAALPGNQSAAVRPLLGLAVLSATLFAIVYLVFVRTSRGQRQDDAALAGWRGSSPELVPGAIDILASIHLGSLLLAFVAIVALGYRRGRLRLALAAGSVIAGAAVTAEALKRFVLTRPTLIVHDDLFGTSNSFPSGHATIAMAVAMSLMLAVSPASRLGTTIAGGTYALAVGAAVVVAGWHRPSDVVAAYLLATIWASLAAAAAEAATTFALAPPPQEWLSAAGDAPSAPRSRPLAVATGLLAIPIVIGILLFRSRVPVVSIVGMMGPAAAGIGLLITLYRLLAKQRGMP